MVAYLILGIALLAGFILLSRWFINARPQAVARGLRIGSLVAGGLFLGFLLISGRWHLSPALLLAALPWIGRLLGRGRSGPIAAGGTGGPAGGQASTVETRFLRMSLDHASGDMRGEVVAGVFAGRDLASLSFDEQIALLRECFEGDAQSARVLEAWLDRVHGPDWRARAREAGYGQTTAGGGMDRQEALEILGLGPDAGEDQINEAWQRLIGRLHPDKGGSDWLAARINQARDVLLGR